MTVFESQTVLDLRRTKARLEKLAERLERDAFATECQTFKGAHALAMEIRNDAYACREAARVYADYLGDEDDERKTVAAVAAE